MASEYERDGLKRNSIKAEKPKILQKSSIKHWKKK